MLKQDGINENRSTRTGGTWPLPRRRTQLEAPVSSTLQEESESQAVRTPPPVKREEETSPWLQVFQNVYYDFRHVGKYQIDVKSQYQKHVIKSMS